MTWIPTAITLSTSAVVIDPQNPSIVYALTNYSGLWVSPDAGQTWPSQLAPLPSAASIIAIGPTAFPMYAGTSGVYKLTSATGQWQPAGLDGINVFSLAVDPKTPTTLYAGTTSGLYQSPDGGATWSASPIGFSGRLVNSVSIDPVSSAVYVGLANGLASDDGGKTWYQTSGGAWQSTNGGQTWTDLRTPKDRSVNALALDPANSLLYCGLQGLGVAVGDARASANGITSLFSLLLGD